MAELATPSAATMSTINAGADHDAKPAKARPEKPDESLYKETLAAAEKAYQAAQDKFTALRAKVDLAQPRNSDSPASKRAQELKTQLASIRQQQSGFKSSRGSVQDKIVALDTQLKSRINEQKAKRAQVQWKSIDEIDREIQRQEKIAESGTATLLEQKKAIAEQSNLRKQKKAFGTFDEAQRGIDQVKAQIAELKKGMDNPEVKALNQQYDAIDKELKAIRSEQDDAYKNLHSLRDEQNKAYGERQEKYKTMKDIKDNYHKARIAYREYDQEQYRQRQAREREQREAYNKEKRRRVAAQKLEEASEPAFADEILTADNLIRYFDPTSAEASKPLRGPSGFAAEALRSIDSSAEIKGTRVMKKTDDEDNYFVGGGGKKGKKGRKGVADASGASTPATGAADAGKFNLSMGIIESLAKVNVEPPMSQADIPQVLTKLRERKEKWKSEQDSKTKENIAKAQKEIDRLEAEAAAEGKAQDKAKKPAMANQGIVNVNGGSTTAGTAAVSAEAELKQEQDAADDVADDMKKAAIEDGQ